MSKTVLVVCAHPDDETLGCGGAIARHVADGDKVLAMMFTTGLRSRGGATDEGIDRRHCHATDAAHTLGFTWYARYDMPDNRMDTVPLLDVVKHVEEAIDDLKPELVYTHHGGDLNIDHRTVSKAVDTATRGLPEQIVCEVREMEVPSSTEFGREIFEPNLFVRLADEEIQVKVAALNCYADETRGWPHPRSARGVEVLAMYRGMCCGCSIAEAFNVVRRRL